MAVTIKQRIEALKGLLSETMLSDRHRLGPRLVWMEDRARSGKVDARVREALLRLQARVEASVRRREARLNRRPVISYPENLPIFAARHKITRAILDNQVIIVTGETGSGKSTQIPKMCLEAGRGISGMVGCTQPRRIAATTVAHRIAEELGLGIGRSVGYKIRFTDRTDPGTHVKIMTDGILLAETQQDPGLYAYDTLIVDEAHERNLNIDFILGLLRKLTREREELKVIITSATIETQKFSDAFDRAPVITVEGRLYPVEVRYSPPDPAKEEAGELTHVERAVQALETLVKEALPGDVLIFMPTEQDIHETCGLLEGRRLPATTVLPLYARLSANEQHRVFAPLPGRKIVVATNVAETSLTIPGIRYVIDTGLARIPRYVARLRTTSLPISPISRSSADQRKGRCGRVRNGVCIRLYSEDDYLSRPEFTPPEILRANLAEVVLRMLSLRLGDVASFPFVDPPNPRSIQDGFELLEELGAVAKTRKGPTLTDKGRIMARIPLDPRISRMLLQAVNEGCVDEVSVIASALSIQDPRDRPVDKATQADQAHGAFRDPHSDFLTLLNLWNRFHRSRDTLKTQGRLRKFCREAFVSYVRMREWQDVHDQIFAILNEQDFKVTASQTRDPSESRYGPIHRSILAGYLSNIATKKEKNIYAAARGREVMLFPGSTLFNKGPDWIVAAEMVKTTRLFARTSARIEPGWLEPLGHGLCRSSYSGPHWSRARGEVMANETVKLYGLVIVPARPVSYARINPAEAHEIFIRSGLMEGEVRERLPFLLHNQALIARLEAMEEKLRRRGLLASDQTVADFYSRRLQGICDIRSLKRLLREKGNDDFLRMEEKDLLEAAPDEELLAAYPDRLAMGERRFPLTYRFAPGKMEDGVTVAIPSTLAAALPSERLDWVVPGLFKEKIAALIKGLPKRYRRQLVPASEAVEIIDGEMEKGKDPLFTALSRFISRRFQVDIPPSEWERVEIPDYLRMRVSLVDHSGEEIASGRDPVILRGTREKASGGETSLEAWQKARAQWERSDLTAWDFGDLPEQVFLGELLAAYPALAPADGHGVAIRLFPDREEALESHRKGVGRLVALALGTDIKFLKKALRWPERMNEAARYFGGARAVEKALEASLIQRLFQEDIRTGEAFQTHVEAVRVGLMSRAKDLLDLAEKVIQAYAQARSVVYAIEKGNRGNEAVRRLCQEVRLDLDRLIPQDVLESCSWDRLPHLPRFVKALEIRVQRGANDVERDRKKAAEAAPFAVALERLEATLSPLATGEKRSAVEEYRWMLEEFRVSLFAQELKTPFPISAKRMKQRLSEIERMQ